MTDNFKKLENSSVAFGRPRNGHSSIQETAKGLIKAFGKAPYKDYKKNDPNYFITLENDDGRERKLWGVHLEKALADSGLGLNDEVAIYDLGTVPVQVKVSYKDDMHRIIRQETKTVQKRLWRIEPLVEEIEAQEKTENTDAVTEQRTIVSAYQQKPIPILPRDYAALEEIWRQVPHKMVARDKRGMDIVLEGKKKIRVMKDRIEFDESPKFRPDAAYIAACEHARTLWDGEMEVYGDKAHLIKSWAYATANGISITNYEPSGAELEEVQKLLSKVQSEQPEGFSRPKAKKRATAPKLQK